MGDPPVPRDPRRGAPARDGLGGHPLGRARLPRRREPHRGLVRDAPILMLCTARPEFLDTRSDWGGGKLNATTLLLQPLDAKASTELIGNLLGGSGLPLEASERITDAAGGNRCSSSRCSMMIDDGQLIRQDGGGHPSGTSRR